MHHINSVIDSNKFLIIFQMTTISLLDQDYDFTHRLDRLIIRDQSVTHIFFTYKITF